MVLAKDDRRDAPSIDPADRRVEWQIGIAAECPRDFLEVCSEFTFAIAASDVAEEFQPLRQLGVRNQVPELAQIQSPDTDERRSARNA